MNNQWQEDTAVRSGIDLFSAWVDAQMAYKNLPGLAAGIVVDKELVWAQGFGYADVARQIPATPDTIYRIASITKLFTAVAILQLRDQGKLQLDDPVASHLPWFALQNSYADAPVITIRHLLTHTAGLPREAQFPYWTDGKFPTLSQIQESVGQQATAVPPETRFKYSNLGLSLAGAIVAQVSGQTYEEYVQEQLLRPLGMSSTFVETLDSHHERLAVGYGRRLPGKLEREIMPFTDCQGITPAANMATTVSDLARFAIFHLSDGMAGDTRLLRQSTLREMQRVHWLNPDWQTGWGLGFSIVRQKEKTYIGHGGAVLGYRTQLRLCPAEGTAVVVLTNADDGDPLAYAEKLFAWVVPPLLAAIRPSPTPAQPDPAWQRYVGKYRDAWGDMQILLHKGALTAVDPSQPDPLLATIQFVPVGEHTFRMETENSFLAPGELAIFEVEAEGDGRVTRVRLGNTFMERVEGW
ncbi:MAG: beta-lactamase family protein [Anaerolineae bacterium]|nr:beta-lactamase family protein [Anaerolineae bacterium]